MARPRTQVKMKCKNCSKLFYVFLCKRKSRKYCSRKCESLDRKRQFCLKGHDTSITGREKRGYCSECKREKNRTYKRGEKPPKQFCKYGHDTFICGRTNSNGQCKQCRKEYMCKCLKTDVQFKISLSLRTRLRLAIRNNSKVGSAVRDLGCTIKSLKKYIERKFYGGMTWENWGKVWQLDHKKALWKFDLTDRKQFLKAVNYKNLQPLTKKDHIIKTVKEKRERMKLLEILHNKDKKVLTSK